CSCGPPSRRTVPYTTLFRSEVAATTAKERAEIKAEADRRVREGEGWQATPETKKGASTKRIVAAILWAVAIILEGVGIWYLLTQDRKSTRLNSSHVKISYAV